MNIQTTLSINQKLKILSDAAKYDVACTSSSADRRGSKGHLEIPVLPVSAIALPPMADVFPY